MSIRDKIKEIASKPPYNVANANELADEIVEMIKGELGGKAGDAKSGGGGGKPSNAPGSSGQIVPMMVPVIVTIDENGQVSVEQKDKQNPG